jgi:hypothetical protein
MKNKFIHLFGFLLLAGTLVFTSCTKDEDTDPNTPNVSFGTGTGFISEDTTIPVNSAFKVNIIATKGSADLKEVAVYRDDVLLGVANIKFNGVDATTNPTSVASFDAAALNWEIEVAGIAQAATHTYRFTVIGEDGLTNSVSVNVTTSVPVTELMGVLLNSAGPAGTGGLNLSNGQGTGSADAAAHIRDNGIDLLLPTATNWRRQIAPANNAKGVKLRKVAAGTTWASIASKGDIVAAFNAAAGDLSVSAVVNVGDLFVVNDPSDNSYYFINIAQVNVTADDNGDNYVIDIKR